MEGDGFRRLLLMTATMGAVSRFVITVPFGARGRGDLVLSVLGVAGEFGVSVFGPFRSLTVSGPRIFRGGRDLLMGLFAGRSSHPFMFRRDGGPSGFQLGSVVFAAVSMIPRPGGMFSFPPPVPYRSMIMHASCWGFMAMRRGGLCDFV